VKVSLELGQLGKPNPVEVSAIDPVATSSPCLDDTGSFEAD